MFYTDLIWQKMGMIAAAMSQPRVPQQKERELMLQGKQLLAFFFFKDAFIIVGYFEGCHVSCVFSILRYCGSVCCNWFLMLGVSPGLFCTSSFFALLAVNLKCISWCLFHFLCSTLASDLMKLCGESKTRSKVHFNYSRNVWLIINVT